MVITPIVASLKAWREALSSGDAKAAIEHHDAVTEHVIKHKNSAVIFSAAQMDPKPFVEWAEIKTTLKEQLAKGPEQMARDYEDALNEADTVLASLQEPESPREVIKLVQAIHKPLQKLVLNASFLDSEEDEIPGLEDEEPELEDEDDENSVAAPGGGKVVGLPPHEEDEPEDELDEDGEPESDDELEKELDEGVHDIEQVNEEEGA